jgi:hypothetical protein
MRCIIRVLSALAAAALLAGIAAAPGQPYGGGAGHDMW